MKRICARDRITIEYRVQSLDHLQVFVCESLANLYLGSASQTERWELRFTGIPVVVLDLGETRSRSKRRIQILLAERGTCFTLWRETIDNLSSYKVRRFSCSITVSRLISRSTDYIGAALWSCVEHVMFSTDEGLTINPGNVKFKKRR